MIQIRDGVASTMGWFGLWSMVLAIVSGVAFLVLAALKLAGVIGWHWLWIAPPVLATSGALVLCLALAVVYISIARVQ